MKFNEVWELNKKMEKSVEKIIAKYPNMQTKALVDTYIAGATDVLEVLKEDTNIILNLRDGKKYD